MRLHECKIVGVWCRYDEAISTHQLNLQVHWKQAIILVNEWILSDLQITPRISLSGVQEVVIITHHHGPRRTRGFKNNGHII